MNADREDAKLAAALRASTAEARRRLDSHPTSDELLEYHDRALAAGDAESLREHLAVCGECAQRALDLEPFSQRALSAGENDSPANAAGEAWRETRRALAEEGLLKESGAASSKGGPRHLFSAPRLAYAAAATFFLTSVGLSLRLADVSRSLSELTRPRTNIRLVGLLPLGAGGQRADVSPPPVIAAAPGEHLVLILNLLDPGSYLRYRLEIVDGREQAIWSTDALTRSPEGDLAVLVPRRLLRSERFLVRLYGIEDEHENFLAEYALLIEDP